MYVPKRYTNSLLFNRLFTFLVHDKGGFTLFGTQVIAPFKYTKREGSVGTLKGTHFAWRIYVGRPKRYTR